MELNVFQQLSNKWGQNRAMRFRPILQIVKYKEIAGDIRGFYWGFKLIFTMAFKFKISCGVSIQIFL